MSWRSVAAAVLAFASVGPAFATTRYTLHESRTDSAASSGWRRAARVSGDAIIPVRIALSQTNLDQGYKKLMEFSDPASSSYGRHLRAEEVIDLFAPIEETASSVRQWLWDDGISPSDVLEYSNKGRLGVDMTVGNAERLFHTQYYEYEHQAHGEVRIGCEGYFLPQQLAEHIDYVVPGFARSAPVIKRSANTRRLPKVVRGEPAAVLISRDQNTGLQNCAQSFTVACYRQKYGIPPNPPVLPGNSLGLYEYDDTYSQMDLDLYFTVFTPYVLNGTAPVVKLIDGATAGVSPTSVRNKGESDVEIGIALPLIHPQTVTMYQVDDLPQTEAANAKGLSGLYNTFLDALDGSYCSTGGGDAPGIDAQYPDPLPGGYTGRRMCGTYTPTRVLSVSYAQAEHDFPAKYQQRQCNEFMKLGLQRHTIFFASGDTGVATYAGDNGSVSGCLPGLGQQDTIFAPYTPSGCPWVTSVGATQLQSNQNIEDPESVLQTAQSNSGYAGGTISGGGFSNLFPAPAYQQTALAHYFAHHDPGLPSYHDSVSPMGSGGGVYNRAGRGYPDVSANGANFAMYVDQTLQHYLGTCLSTPLWASIITLINKERQAVGKGPVGFINPVLHQHAARVLTDIRNGSIPGCGSPGFSAVEGWDLASGLGTPRYPALLRLFLSLP
ncbi:hypothetical protein LTR53_016335 [Teratosphaeriaceae sp. CCFEE 6253]|nr:hypothetical protein LTR53_016335 [Teratosphaeriaceae sp. CCFEE 6253]